MCLSRNNNSKVSVHRTKRIRINEIAGVDCFRATINSSYKAHLQQLARRCNLEAMQEGLQLSGKVCSDSTKSIAHRSAINKAVSSWTLTTS